MDTNVAAQLTELWNLFKRLDREKNTQGDYFHQLVLWPDGSGHVDYSMVSLHWETLPTGISMLSRYLTSGQHHGARTFEAAASADVLLAAWPVFQEYVKTLPTEDTEAGPSQADPPGLMFCMDGSGTLLYGPLAQWSPEHSAADVLRSLLPQTPPVPMLQPKEETTFVLDFHELDNLIQERLGLTNFEGIADEEWGNDESHVLDIYPEGYGELAREQTAEILATGDTAHATRHLLSELADRKLIPWGKYRIDISW